jgi:hypothetical protein
MNANNITPLEIKNEKAINIRKTLSLLT